MENPCKKSTEIKVSVILGGGISVPIHNLGEETVIQAIESDLQEFNSAFKKNHNDPLTIHERMILKSYLWYKTKIYVKEFYQEICGMNIDSFGTVRLIAIDNMLISYHCAQESYEDKFRVYNNDIKLGSRGKKDHDTLVKSWVNWKINSQMVITGTKITEHNVGDTVIYQRNHN